MLKNVINNLIAVVVFVSTVSIAETITLQPKWSPQAQFAGYYVALSKGLYKEVGLDVVIKEGGVGIVPSEVISKGNADVIIEWLPAALQARENGIPLVNIAQIFNVSGLMLTCHKDSGIESPNDLVGKTVGVWHYGNEYPFLNWMDSLGISINTPDGVTMLVQGFDVGLMLKEEADCISTMSYNEYWTLLDKGLEPEELLIFKYADQGLDTLEDGLYVLEDRLDDPHFVAVMARFIAASLSGWEYARKYPAEAARISLEYDKSGKGTLAHQQRMMDEVNKLTKSSNGKLDERDFDRTVEILMQDGSNRVITKVPTNAWTHDVIDKAVGLIK